MSKIKTPIISLLIAILIVGVSMLFSTILILNPVLEKAFDNFTGFVGTHPDIGQTLRLKNTLFRYLLLIPVLTLIVWPLVKIWRLEIYE